MSKKQKLSILLLVLFTIGCLWAVLVLQNKAAPEKETALGKLTEIGEASDYYDPEEVSDYADTGGDLIEDGSVVFENGVICDNINILTNTSLPLYGIHSLEPYMLRYLNYYIGENEYHIEIMDYQDDINFPSFHVTLQNTGDEINCTYNIATQRYTFTCSAIESRHVETEDTDPNRITIKVE